MSRQPSRTPTPAQRAAERTGRRQVNRYEFLRIYRYVAATFGAADRSVLDYGCGSGYGTALLAEHFGRACGVDVYPATVADCQAAYPRSNLEFRLLEPPTLPYPASSFDVITSFQVVEHVAESELDGYFGAIWSMLRPGGVAVVTTPNANNYHGGHSGNPHHVREYTVEEMRDLARRLWPSTQVDVRGQRDVPSTRVGIRIRRMLRGSRISWPVARVAVQPLRMLELAGVVDTGPGPRMFDTARPERTIGGVYLELRKPPGQR